MLLPARARARRGRVQCARVRGRPRQLLGPRPCAGVRLRLGLRHSSNQPKCSERQVDRPTWCALGLTLDAALALPCACRSARTVSRTFSARTSDTTRIASSRSSRRRGPRSTRTRCSRVQRACSSVRSSSRNSSSNSLPPRSTRVATRRNCAGNVCRILESSNTASRIMCVQHRNTLV